ncbi:MAG: SIS domain-containing protein [Methanomassiliicoccus sp.]|nr:SIS domain-containing protein [Methanomassiliicoccus sp.]
MKDSLDYILRNVKEALVNVDPAAVEQTIQAFIGAKKIFIYGVGRSGLIGQAFAVRLVQMGFDVHFVGDMTTPFVDEGDLVIIVSNTGETMSAVQTANIVRRVGARVISVTSNPNSKLGHASNIILEVGQIKDDQKKKWAPLGTIFEDAALVMFDSIVPLIMERTDQNEASLRRRHAIWV